MAEHAHTLTTTVSAESVWEFVRDMDHWAPFLLGYQAHAKKSDDESIWTIKADVGAMSRTVDFRVHITEWAEPERIRFTLEGIGEPMQGEGSFKIDVLDPSEAASALLVAGPQAPGFFVRLWATLLRRLLGRGETKGQGTAASRTGPAAVRLTFRLSMTPEGAMAPMLTP